MDARHFDVLTRTLASSDSRRRLLAALAAIPALGGLFALLSLEEATARGRRHRRRVKRHKHGKGRRRKHKRKPKCTPDTLATTCAGKCGSVTNNCQQAVDCGSCDCAPACAACFTCQGAAGAPGTCVPQAAGTPCGDAATCTGGTLQPRGSCNGSSVCEAAAPVPCDPYAQCDGNACATSCSGNGECVASNICCDAGCIDGQTDDANCGSCGHACGAGQTCQGGVCGVACGSDFCPAASELCVDGACQPCDVICAGSAAECGAALQAALNGSVATPHVCPGIYRGGFTIGRTVTVIGAGQGEDDKADTILDAHQSGRVLAIASATIVDLRSLRLRGGYLTAGSEDAAAIVNLGALLTMHDCTLTDNHVSLNTLGLAQGGAVFNGAVSQLAMTGCTFSRNSVANANASGSAQGGAVYNAGTLTMTGCVIRDNAAQRQGGGLFNNSGTSNLDNCRITENTLTGPPLEGGGIGVNNGSVTLTASYIWDNTQPDCFGNVIGTGCGVAPPS